MKSLVGGSWDVFSLNDMVIQMDNLQQLLEAYHEYLDEFFLIHQEALIAGDIVMADEYLAYFSELMRLHIKIENEYLLPLFERCVPKATAHWPASLYKHEHNKITQLLDGVEQLMNKLGEPLNRRDIINLLDKENRFKNVVEHHEQREEMAFIPELVGQLSLSDHQQLLLSIQQQWPSLDALAEELSCRKDALLNYH